MNNKINFRGNLKTDCFETQEKQRESALAKLEKQIEELNLEINQKIHEKKFIVEFLNSYNDLMLEFMEILKLKDKNLSQLKNKFNQDFNALTESFSQKFYKENQARFSSFAQAKKYLLDLVRQFNCVFHDSKAKKSSSNPVSEIESELQENIDSLALKKERKQDEIQSFDEAYLKFVDEVKKN